MNTRHARLLARLDPRVTRRLGEYPFDHQVEVRVTDGPDCYAASEDVEVALRGWLIGEVNEHPDRSYHILHHEVQDGYAYITFLFQS